MEFGVGSIGQCLVSGAFPGTSETDGLVTNALWLDHSEELKPTLLPSATVFHGFSDGKAAGFQGYCELKRGSGRGPS